MKIKIITRNGSIIGKIPFRMAEPTPEPDCPYGSESDDNRARTYLGRSTRSPRSKRSREVPRNETPITARASRPREVQSAAIAEYREAALSTRSIRATRDMRRQQERREPRERQTETRRTHSAPSSDSDEAVAPKRSKPSRATGGTSDVKYLIRGFLRSTSRSKPSSTSDDDGGDDGRKASASGDSFFPSPKITFLIDQPGNLVCQICQETPLKMALSCEDREETTPMILPCGHVACHGCMSSWLAAHNNCPFCRQDMVHTGCGHKVEPRLIAHDTIGSLPSTLADRGIVRPKCHPCQDRDRRQEALGKWQVLATNFKAARREAEKISSAAADQVLDTAQRAFEDFSQVHALISLDAHEMTW